MLVNARACRLLTRHTAFCRMNEEWIVLRSGVKVRRRDCLHEPNCACTHCLRQFHCARVLGQCGCVQTLCPACVELRRVAVGQVVCLGLCGAPLQGPVRETVIGYFE